MSPFGKSFRFPEAQLWSRNWLLHPLFREHCNSTDGVGILKADLRAGNEKLFKGLGEVSPAGGETLKQKIKIRRTKVKRFF